MNKIILQFAILFLYITPLSSQEIQNASNNWYFGDRAGINFNTSPPTVLTDGQLDTQEGVAAISDNNGALLFYTDGITVWDRTHQAMPSANGTLDGHWSSTQSAIIVPNLMDPNIYYIFTTDELGGSNGLSYTTIDMSLPGNGNLSSPLGNVISGGLNIQLVTPVTEKITGVLKSDYSGYWIIAHGWNNNRFYAFEVTCAGINTDPIISDVGNVHSGNPINTVGYMKATVDGQNLALVNRNSGTIDLYDFDNNTGIVSNEIEIKPNDPLIYGLEFSFSGDYLYIGGTDIISRYTMSSGILTNILIDDPSQVNNTNVVRALQLGPDENIYVSVRNLKHVSAIYNPEGNNPILTVNAIPLDPDGAGRNCRFGLPNIFYFDLVPLDSITLIACPNGQVEYNGEFYQPGTVNEVNLISIDGCDSTVILTVEAFDVYDEILEVEACEDSYYDFNGTQILAGTQESFTFLDMNGCDSIITVNVEELAGSNDSLDVSACEGTYFDFNGTQILAGTQENFTYSDINGCDSTITVIVEELAGSNDSLDVSACEGTYFDFNGTQILAGTQETFTYSDMNGCDSTVTVIVEELAGSNDSLDVSACEGTYFDFNGTQILAGTQETFTYSDMNGCDSIIKIIVNELTNPNAYAQVQDTLTCINVNVSIQGSGSSGLGVLEYDWQFGGNSFSTDEDINVSVPGVYTLIITDIDNGCNDEAQVEVFQDIQEPIPVVTTSGLIYCTTEIVMLDGGESSGNGNLLFDWQDSNGNSIGNDSTLEVNVSGTFTLIITDISNGCSATESTTVDIDNGISLGDFIFLDNNENGIQDTGEPGVANAYVQLYSGGPDNILYTDDDQQEDSELTGSNGLYLFKCVEPGEYYIRFSLNTNTYSFSSPYQGNNEGLDSNADPITGTTQPIIVFQDMPDNLSYDAGVHYACDDYTYGGTIGQNQIICPGDEAETLYTVVPPSGGSGTPEYLWIKSVFPNNSWMEIPNSNIENYNPGPIYITTTFVRCIKREGCNSYIIESENQVVITVLPDDDEYCTGGIIDPENPKELSTEQTNIAYPNPVSNKLKVESTSAKTSGSTFYLYNSMGQLIDVITIEGEETTFEIDMKNHKTGLYFLHYLKVNDKDHKVLKIIKE